jgi:hypothetical protein
LRKKSWEKAPEHRSQSFEVSIDERVGLASETRASFSFFSRSSAKRFRRVVTTRTPDSRAAAARAFDFFASGHKRFSLKRKRVSVSLCFVRSLYCTAE